MKNGTIQFIIWFIVAFAISFLVLYFFNLIPEDLKPAPPVPAVSVSASDANANVPGWITESDPAAEPIHIVIAKIGVDADVANPKTTDPNVLNADLLNGAVHYPGSGTLADTSNVFIFGHSTNHPVVKNQAYKTFNRLDELNIGDQIEVRSASAIYIYRVSGVSKVLAQEALVSFSNTRKMLTISTCDTFGQKEDRFVVEAEFVKTVPIAD